MKRAAPINGHGPSEQYVTLMLGGEMRPALSANTGSDSETTATFWNIDVPHPAPVLRRTTSAAILNRLGAGLISSPTATSSNSWHRLCCRLGRRTRLCEILSIPTKRKDEWSSLRERGDEMWPYRKRRDGLKITRGSAGFEESSLKSRPSFEIVHRALSTTFQCRRPKLFQVIREPLGRVWRGSMGIFCQLR